MPGGVSSTAFACASPFRLLGPIPTELEAQTARSRCGCKLPSMQWRWAHTHSRHPTWVAHRNTLSQHGPCTWRAARLLRPVTALVGRKRRNSLLLCMLLSTWFTTRHAGSHASMSKPRSARGGARGTSWCVLKELSMNNRSLPLQDPRTIFSGANRRFLALYGTSGARTSFGASPLDGVPWTGHLDLKR